MPKPQLKYIVDEESGSCCVTGATFLLSPSLEKKIGFMKNDQNVYTLCFDDSRTPDITSALLQKLCDQRGWDLVIA